MREILKGPELENYDKLSATYVCFSLINSSQSTNDKILQTGQV